MSKDIIVVTKADDRIVVGINGDDEDVVKGIIAIFRAYFQALQRNGTDQMVAQLSALTFAKAAVVECAEVYGIEVDAEDVEEESAEES